MRDMKFLLKQKLHIWNLKEFSCHESSKKMLVYYDDYFNNFEFMKNISKMLHDFLKYLMAEDSFQYLPS